MENNIKFLEDFFDKELVVLSKDNNIESFLFKNNLSNKDLLIERNFDEKRHVKIFIVSKRDKIHIVKPGETLSSISNKYNVSIDIISKKNNISKIFIGQQLKI